MLFDNNENGIRISLKGNRILRFIFSLLFSRSSCIIFLSWVWGEARLCLCIKEPNVVKAMNIDLYMVKEGIPTQALFLSELLC